MERYVVSRKLAEKLKVAGYPQTTEFTWYLDGDDTPALNWTDQGRIVGGVYHTDKCAAPLSDELLEQLPKEDKVLGYLELCQDGDNWMSRYTKVPRTTVWCKAIKPADALAELWLWCKENGHITEARR